jgi:hypothetical protein
MNPSCRVWGGLAWGKLSVIFKFRACSVCFLYSTVLSLCLEIGMLVKSEVFKLVCDSFSKKKWLRQQTQLAATDWETNFAPGGIRSENIVGREEVGGAAMI